MVSEMRCFLRKHECLCFTTIKTTLTGENFSNLPDWPCEPYSTLRRRSDDKNTGGKISGRTEEHLNKPGLHSAGLTRSSDANFTPRGQRDTRHPHEAPAGSQTKSPKSTCVSDPVPKKGTRASVWFHWLEWHQRGRKEVSTLLFSAFRPVLPRQSLPGHWATPFNPAKSVRCGHLHSKGAWRRGPNAPQGSGSFTRKHPAGQQGHRPHHRGI